MNHSVLTKRGKTNAVILKYSTRKSRFSDRQMNESLGTPDIKGFKTKRAAYVEWSIMNSLDNKSLGVILD